MLYKILSVGALCLQLLCTPSSLLAESVPYSVEAGADLRSVYFLGHLNPDSDAIFGAIAMAHFHEGIAARSGKLNSESEYILKRFDLPVPVLIENTPDKKYYLVDFNQKTQLLAGVLPQQIIGIIDHHAIQSAYAGPAEPIDLHIKRWGSVCTIITELYLQKGREIPPAVAGGLLGGIISDTLFLRSPTTTAADRAAIELLSDIAEVKDLGAFARDIFEAKSSIAHLSAYEIVQQDFKTFDFNGISVGMGVVETLYPEQVLARKQELLNALTAYKAENKLPLLFFAIIQPETKESTMVLIGEEEARLAKKFFGSAIVEHLMDTSPRVSRKLEFVPIFKNYFMEVQSNLATKS
jgi:manganese-dependent inorganic pyrophosphatase